MANPVPGPVARQPGMTRNLFQGMELCPAPARHSFRQGGEPRGGGWQILCPESDKLVKGCLPPCQE
jgi:hypothetical protein